MKNDPVDLHFRIQDTGIGIPEEKINNIFKPFSQLVSTRNAHQRGTGLGLVIAGELVEMMGGKISVESQPGVGTSFYFTIRFTPGAADTAFHQIPAQSSPDRRDEPNIRPLNILLVEDEYINQTLAVTVLEREGWQVRVAENGIQAMDMLKNNKFDMILMDVQMPELDGYETTKAIRREEKHTRQHIPIIAMTAYAVKGDRKKCLAAGIDGYISKPIHSDNLIHEIQTVLQAGSTPRN